MSTIVTSTGRTFPGGGLGKEPANFEVPYETIRYWLDPNPLTQQFQFFSPGLISQLQENPMNGYTLFDVVLVMIPSDGKTCPDPIVNDAVTSKSEESARTNTILEYTNKIRDWKRTNNDEAAEVKVFVRPFGSR